MQLRLDKYLADMGIGTRTQVKQYIRKNQVLVNGLPPEGPQQKVTDSDMVTFQGSAISYQKYKYYMFHKPKGCVSAAADNRHKTVLDYFPEYSRKGLFPVGRLDLDSEGLLLLTNDGALAQRLTHPSGEAEKTYHVWVRGPAAGAAERLSRLRELEGEPILPAWVETLRQGEGRAVLAVTIRQGKNRQVRRMCAACGLEVERLRRVREHTLELGDLPPGKWRYLTAGEIEALRGGER